jgi:hypothetical protein
MGGRRGGVPADVVARAALPRGEKVLAGAGSRDGTWVLGTRRLLVVLPPDGPADAVPWEQVEDAAWDAEESRLRITLVGEFGRPRPSYLLVVEEPALLLQLVRERVTASIVLQRRVPVHGRRGFTVIGRRSPVGGQVAWMTSYDEGVDPADPEVQVAVERALAGAQAEVGETPDGAPYPI